MAGQSAINIGVTMFLRDQFSGPANRIKSSAKGIQQQLGALKQQQENLRYTRNLATGMAAIGVAGIRGIGQAVKKSAALNYELQFIQSITDATIEQQKQMADLSKDLAESTMFYSQDVAEGMRFMGMAGMDATEVLENIKAATYLAGSTMHEIGGKGGTADIVTNVMRAFNIGANQSMATVDKLTTAVTKSNTNIFDLGEALKYSASTAMDLGVPLEEAVAMVMSLGNAGMQGSMAGVAMENSMRYVAKAMGQFGSGTQKKALSQLGLGIQDLTDSRGNLLGMVTVIEKIGTAIEQNFGQGMNVEKQAILQTIFGVRGKRAGSLFIRDLQNFSKQVHLVTNESMGMAEKVMGKQMNTMQGQINRTASALKNLIGTIGNNLEPVAKVLMSVMEFIFRTIRKILKMPILGTFLTGAVAGFIVLKTVTLAYRAVALSIAMVNNRVAQSALAMGVQMKSAYDVASMSAMKYAAISASVATTAAGRASAGGAVKYNQKLFRGTGGYMATAAGGGMKTFKSASAARAFVNPGKIASKRAAGGILGRLGGARLLGLLGGIKGILISLAISGIVTLIASLIQRFRSNREALEANTAAQKVSLEHFKNRELRAIEYLGQNQERISSFAEHGASGKLDAQTIAKLNQLYPRSEGWQGAVTEHVPITVQVVVDGRVIQEEVKNYVQRSLGS